MGKISSINSTTGGIVGNNGGITEKCENRGKIERTGIASENSGGIAGWNGGTITECTNKGEISATNIDIGGIVGDTKNEGNNVKSCTNEGNVTGFKNVGGIAGYSERTKIDNCSNNGIIVANGIFVSDDNQYHSSVGGIVGYAKDSSEIKNSHNHNVVKSTKGISIGGIAGTVNNNCVVDKCYNEGKIGVLEKGISECNVGGICGDLSNESTITKCFNLDEINGDVAVGGIVGIQGWKSKAYINNCYNTGKITSITGRVGGISEIAINTTGSEIKNCYNIGNVNATEPNDKHYAICGGIVGTENLEKTTVENCYYLEGTCKGAVNLENKEGKAESRTEEEMKGEYFIEELNKDNKETVWEKDENGGYPILE